MKGKTLHAALKVVAKAKGKDNRLLDSFTIPSGFIVATELKSIIEEAVAAVASAPG